MVNNFLFFCLTILLFISNLSANKDINLKLSWKHQFQFAGFYMAKHKGFYKKYDLNVNFIEFTNNLNKNTINKYHFAIGRSSLLIDIIKHNKDILLLNAIFQNSPIILLAKKNSSIQTIKDIKNKKIMVLDDKSDMSENEAMLLSQGLKFNAYKKIKHTFNINDLIDDKTDLISAYLSNEPFLLKQRGIKSKIFNPKDYGLNFYGDLLYTTNKFYKKNPKIVENFQKASLQGWKYAFENINETVDFIYLNYNTLNKSKQALLYEAKVLKELAYVNDIPFGNINEFKLENTKNIYTLLGLVKNKKIKIKNLIYKKKIKDLLSYDEKEFLRNNTITIGIDSWKPIIYFNKKQKLAKGIIADIMDIIIKQTNMKVKYISKPWDQLLDDFKNKKIDFLPGAYYTTSREKYSLYSKPLFEIKEYLYINNKNTSINNFNDLKNKKIAIVKGYATIEDIKQKYPSIKIVLTSTLDESVSLLLQNKVDAIFDTQISIQTFLNDNMISGLKAIYQKEFKANPVYIITNPNKKILHKILNKYLNNISKNKINSIASLWLNKKINNTSLVTILNDEERDYISNKKTINICTKNNYEPIEFSINNNSKGISIDILKIIEQKLDTNFQYIPTNSTEEALNYLKTNKCDMLSSVIKTKDLAKELLFTNDYLNYKLSIITKTNIPVVDSLKQFSQNTMSRKKTCPVINMIKEKYPNINILPMQEHLDSFMSVKRGESDFTLEVLPIASHLISSHALYDLHIAGESKIPFNMSFAVGFNDKILLNILNKSIKNIKKEKITAIHNKWVYHKKSINHIVDYTYFYYILLVLSFITLIMLFRQYLLNKANENLKIVVNEKTKELKSINNNLEIKIKNEVQKSNAMREKLYQNEKLAAMGEMIGNIAHQWRQPINLISIISSSISLELELNLLNEKTLNNKIKQITSSTKFLSDTINDFRDLIKGDSKKDEFYLYQNINKCLLIELPILNINNITLIKDIDNSIKLFTYPNLLIQAIINIINNAKDILVENNPVDKYIFINAYKNENEIIIKIKDNGGGINFKIINHIFEPYFTTKHKSQGTGLGLNITYNMITNDINGEISVYNERFTYNNKKYAGAVFIIKIPISKS